MILKYLTGSSPRPSAGDVIAHATTRPAQERSTAERATSDLSQDCHENASFRVAGRCLHCGASLVLIDDVHHVRNVTVPQRDESVQPPHPTKREMQQEQLEQPAQPLHQRPEVHDVRQQQQHAGGGRRQGVGELKVEGTPCTRRPLPPAGQPHHDPSFSDQPQQPERVQSPSIGTTQRGIYTNASTPQRAEVASAQSPAVHLKQVPSELGGSNVHRPENWRNADDAARQIPLVEDHLLCATCFQSTVAELHQQLQQETELLHKYETALHTLRRQVRQGGPSYGGGNNRRTDQQPTRHVKTPYQTQQQPNQQQQQDPGHLHAELWHGEEAEDEEALLVLSDERLLQELEAIECEREEATVRQDDMLSEQLMLLEQKEELWLLLAQQQQERLLDDDETTAVKRQLQHAQAHLQRLKHVNVINDAFFITVQDGFPSINSCRLGRAGAGDRRNGSSPPSWEEINLGWGHMCFLLDVLFRKLYVHPRHYRLVPRGPSSCLIRKGDGVVLPLQGGGGETTLGRLFFSSHRFDAATAAFLECVQEFFEALTHFARQPWPPYSTSTVQPLHPPELPFLIEGDRIGGLSIRMQCSQDELWTKAVKYLLIDMKWLLAYTEKVCAPSPNAGAYC